MPANARSHAVLTTESKVTIRGQTTIPAPVREALKLKPGQDSIHYEILPGGQVFMCRLGDEQEDHTMNAFLRFLDADIQNNPRKTRPFNIQQGKKLVAGGNDSNLLIVFYVQIMPDDFVMQLHRF
ncbi:type II toxin-antitoxin system PrlF family antitoxin [Escherichia coli]|uniref:type II toxin-antitoxin system PrlF family antitoxin n=1 Tax=Escherichia coli TaxID=562 RepID=UPI00226FC574|nr:type II toxin-antitoxin system PrlF family antitoxin [Escherichia coli]